jgi:putative FmdB family regulatory protein
MPTYEYQCKSCGHTFEAFQSMKDDALTECPQCGKDIRRLINGGAGIIFKGSGFYVTDKKNSHSKAPAKTGDTKTGDTTKNGDAAKTADSAKSDTKSGASEKSGGAKSKAASSAASSGGSSPGNSGGEKAAG